MRRALDLARKGQYKVAPNPMVGAVIVHNDQIIGEGYHREYGSAHAEVNAVNSVNDQSLLPESTIYVTLEPCSHFGKTPPCSDLIIEKKFKSVVISVTDPSDKVSGRGIEKIRANGIKIKTAILEKEGIELNKRFFNLHAKRRPYITLKWALSKDGYMARKKEDPNLHDSWITNNRSKQLVHQWRAEEMGILIGKNTAIIDDPELTCREFEGKSPIRFLIDPQLEVNNKSKIFNSAAKTVVLNTIRTDRSENLDYLQYNTEGGLFISLFEYCLENEIHSLFVEGGPGTLKQFIKEGFWDEARIFQGTKIFEDGIEGPILKFDPIEVEMVEEDQLAYYKNPET